MMSDSEEKLDDLHQSILSLCGADVTVIEVNNDSPRKSETQEKGSEEFVPDIGKSPSKSESSTLYSCSEFDTVDETSCSDDMYTTTSEEMSGWSPPKSLRKSELLLMHTMDETDGDVTSFDGLKQSQNNTQNKTENLGKGAYTPALGLSPIKDFEKDPAFLPSEPATPSFLDSGKFSKFAQSTPLHAALTKVAASNNLQVIKEQKIDRNENESRNFAKSGSKKISMFQNDESELSNMDFDELLSDTFKLCKGSDDDWDKFFHDTKMLPRRSPSFDHEVNEEDREKQIDDKTSLKEWKMLYANDDTQGQSGENQKTSTIYNTQMDESQLDTTIIAKNETLDSKKSEIHANMFDISKQQNKNETPDDNESRKDGNSCAKETASDLKDSSTADKNLPMSKDSNQNIPSTSKDSNQNIPSTSKDSNQNIPSTSTSKCSDQSYILAPSKGQEHNLSKINMESFFSNELKSKEQGRFSNLTTSLLSDIDITEDESEVDVSNSEDVLGLNNFTYSEADDIDLDDEDEATLLDETITDLPESIKNKYKLQEQISILIQPDKTIAHNDQNKTVCEKEATIAPTDVNKNFMKTSDDMDDNKEKIFDEIEKVDAEVKETEVKVTEVKVTEEERPEIEKVTGKIDYEAERKYFDIQSPEVRDIINQWESKGIQDPNTNLSFASNIRSKNHIKKGMLEGTHLTCIWLQESVEAEKNCSSPMKKRQKLDSEAHTRQDIMNVEQEFSEIQFRHQASLNGLLQEWEYEKENLEGRKKQLRCRQTMEMKENYVRFRFINIPMFKMNVMRLHSEHTQQLLQCKAMCDAELEKIRHIFQRREFDIERNFNHRKAQLRSLIEQIKHVKSDGKYGHHVTAQFVKGPCRSNKNTRSLVEVYVPAAVAKCILREDETFDSFYKYA
ncbi:dentin sialophosphoprotein-like [Mytilus edulis]|uniref:dentin sialophosphoprotein-like n=1 Tax=Mytilus edulis TaxID=6550 RepID=UPI0039F0D326